MRVWSLFLAYAAVAAASAPAAAAILAQYNFNGSGEANGSEISTEPNDAAPVPGVSVTSLTNGIAGDLFQQRTSGVRYVTDSADNFTWALIGNRAASTYTTGDTNYLTLTITPDPLTSITLGDLSIRMGVARNGGIGGTHTIEANIHTSLDYSTLVGTMSHQALDSGSNAQGRVG